MDRYDRRALDELYGCRGGCGRTSESVRDFASIAVVLVLFSVAMSVIAWLTGL